MPILVQGGLERDFRVFGDGTVLTSRPHEVGGAYTPSPIENPFVLEEYTSGYSSVHSLDEHFFVPTNTEILLTYLEYPCIDCGKAEATDDWTERCAPCRQKYEENREPGEPDYEAPTARERQVADYAEKYR